MKHTIRQALVVLLGVGVAGVTGCEWGGGGQGSSGSWNDRYNFVNFSGYYRASGGYLVSSYSTTSATTSTETSSGYVLYTGENGGTTGNNRVSFSGKTAHAGVKPGSVTIVFGGVSGSARDDGEGGMEGSFVIGGTGGATNAAVTGGSFEYDTGVWTLQVASPGMPVGQTITLNYSAAGGSTDDSTSGTSGASGVEIYAFTVQQTGNSIKIIDNNGSVYEGGMGDVRTTLGTPLVKEEQGNDFPAFSDGDQIMASFEASGKSAANVGVHIVGTLQGCANVVNGSSDANNGTVTLSVYLSERRMFGTWIEDGGKTGEINGQAGGTGTAGSWVVTVSSNSATTATAITPTTTP